MRRQNVRFALVALACAAWDCDSVTGPPAIGISLSTAVIAVAQGRTDSVGITIDREQFDGDVTLAIEGLPEGVTALLSPKTLRNGTGTAKVILAATHLAASGPAPVSISATGTGVDEASATLALTISVTGSYAITASPASISLYPGSVSGVTLSVVRNDGFAQPVGVAVTGLPTGVTAQLADELITGTSSSVTLVADESVGIESTGMTITSSSGGLADQTTFIPFTVEAVPAGRTVISLQYCDGLDVWKFAYRNAGGVWTLLDVGPAQTYTWLATSRTEYATAWRYSTHSWFTRVRVTAKELKSASSEICSRGYGSGTAGGTVRGLDGLKARVSMFAGSTTTESNFVLGGLPPRRGDLVALRVTPADDAVSVIIRRDVEWWNGTFALDFASSETMSATETPFSAANLGSDSVEVSGGLRTVLGTATKLFTYVGPPATVANVPMVPSALLDASDVQYVIATGLSSRRRVEDFFHDAAGVDIAFGPALNVPTFAAINAENTRFSARLTSQAEYGGLVEFGFDNTDIPGESAINIVTTAGYMGGRPAVWHDSIPSIPGFPKISSLDGGGVVFYSASAASSIKSLNRFLFARQGDYTLRSAWWSNDEYYNHLIAARSWSTAKALRSLGVSTR